MDTARVRLRGPGPGDYGRMVARHGEIYAQEYGWNEEFEGLVATIVGGFASGHDPRCEALWIAELDGTAAGWILCVRRDERTAQLRCLLVEPSARGAGIGSMLIDECVRFARQAGYARIVLWTNDVLVDARRLYERAGFVLAEEGRMRAFGRDIVEQTWSLDLAG